MKLVTGIICAVLFIFAVADSNGQQPATQPSATALSPFDAIGQAPDPSAAINAYANARVTLPDKPVEIESAYVHRMIDFGVPALAEAQARDLVQRDPKNGQAWAVLAYMDAKRGQTDAAMSEIETAGKFSPDDPFVQSTAGQLLAWYDSGASINAVSEPVARGVPLLREMISTKPEFAGAYQAAMDEYRQEGFSVAVGPTTSPARNPYEGSIIESIRPVNAPQTYYDNGAPYEPYYSSPPTYSRALYPDYGYWDRYWPDGWWWFGSNVVIVDRFGHRFHDFDHHDRRDHRSFSRFSSAVR